jgi:hypothetical protein
MYISSETSMCSEQFIRVMIGIRITRFIEYLAVSSFYSLFDSSLQVLNALLRESLQKSGPTGAGVTRLLGSGTQFLLMFLSLFDIPWNQQEILRS